MFFDKGGALSKKCRSIVLWFFGFSLPYSYLCPMNIFREQNWITAKTFAGLEPLLEQELLTAGIKVTESVKRGFRFQATEAEIYRLNYTSRIAIRFLLEVAQFQFYDKQQFYSQVNAIGWDAFISPGQTIEVQSFVAGNEDFSNSHYVELLAKDAVVDFFRDKYKRRPSVDKLNPSLKIDVHIIGNQCTISVDTSGESLNRRGYRRATFAAPLNEILAAALIQFSGWKFDCDFIDPMCGSGTILIEAAFAANGIPAGFLRKQWGFMNWKSFDKDLFDKIKKEASIDSARDFEYQIMGFDRSDTALAASQQNIESAGLTKDIRIHLKEFFHFEHKGEQAIYVFNPPYDVRLEVEDSTTFYQKIGDSLKKNFAGSRVCMLVGNELLWKSIGLKPTRKIPMLNGKLESRFVIYDIYEGSKKHKSLED